MLTINELNHAQKQHMQWRLESLGVRMLEAAAVLQGRDGNLPIDEVFRRYAGRSERSSKIQSAKVLNYGKE